jgi:hypothetical protein
MVAPTTIGARLKNDGTLLTAGITPGNLDTGFDEVTGSNHKVTKTNIFAGELDEITLPSGQPSGGSVLMNGTTQYLSLAGTGDFQFGTSDFTIEGWFYSTSSAYQRLWCFPDGDNVEIMGTQVYYWKGSGAPIGSGSNSFHANAWTHIALVKSSGVAKVYINGLARIVDNSPFNSATSRALAIGGEVDLGIDGQGAVAGRDGYFVGKITQFRIVKGLAVYTNTFSTPINPLQKTQNSGINISAITGSSTKLLLKVIDSSSLVTDSSDSTQSVTNNGSATFDAGSPSSTTFNGAMKQFKNGKLLVQNEFDEYTGIV